MKKGYVEIGLILDKSGSMSYLEEKAVEGFNVFIEEQKKSLEGKEVKFSLVLFDTIYNKVIDCVKFEDVKKMKQTEYTPGGCTALLDAIGRLTDELGERFTEMGEDERPESVIIAIITDGEENASVDFSAEAIKNLIKRQENDYNWSYLFLSSDLNSINNAQRLYGFQACNTVHFAASEKGYVGDNSSYKSLSKSISSKVNTEED